MFAVKRKSHVSIAMNDYVMRVLVSKRSVVEEPVIYEIPLPKNVLQEGIIVDEMTLFEVMKANLSKWGGKKQKVRFVVPDTSVLLKTFDHPVELTGKKIKEYVQMELEHSIHLPFSDALVDVYDPIEGDGQAVLFATPSEEVGKFIGLLLDHQLQPQIADIRALCNLRFLEHAQRLDTQKTYIVTDWAINELSICIYSAGNVEFLRFQTMDIEGDYWQEQILDDSEVTFRFIGNLDDHRAALVDQVQEIERMMNFYKFSLHNGTKIVDEIIILGDHPSLKTIQALLQETIEIPSQLIDDAVVQQHFPTCNARHVTLLGLALKGVSE